MHIIYMNNVWLEFLRGGADQGPDLREFVVPGLQGGIQIVYDPVSAKILFADQGVVDAGVVVGHGDGDAVGVAVWIREITGEEYASPAQYRQRYILSALKERGFFNGS